VLDGMRAVDGNTVKMLITGIHPAEIEKVRLKKCIGETLLLQCCSRTSTLQQHSDQKIKTTDKGVIFV